MTKQKRSPRQKAKVIAITPAYLLLKDACDYVGMREDMFREVSAKYGLSIYAYGPKKTWYKKEELDRMIESFQIKKPTLLAASKTAY